MSDDVQTTPSTDDQKEKETKSDTPSCPLNDEQTSSPARLFGQFKPNGFSSLSAFGQIGSQDKTDDTSPSTTYFTSTLSKISSVTTSGFGTSSAPLAASLASLGANRPLFGGLSSTTPSSFTDLKPTSNHLLKRKEKTSESEKEIDEDNKEESKREEKEASDEEDDEENEDEENSKASLLENVAEYEAKRASTHPAATIQGDTSTGEENEITKFQMTGKLFVYCGEQQQFVERGFGTLKINETHDPIDWDRLQARLIMRLDRSFRVILNSPIFPKMTVDRVNDRSVRFGAQDDSQLRVFIMRASANDCSNLYKELQSRIQIIERQQLSISSNVNTSLNSSISSASSEVSTLDDSTSKRTSLTGQRKRSHSKSDSDSSDSANDQSKKSKMIEENHEVNKDADKATNEVDSVEESTKANEDETSNS